jgi:hypothetical protein
MLYCQGFCDFSSFTLARVPCIDPFIATSKGTRQQAYVFRICLFNLFKASNDISNRMGRKVGFLYFLSMGTWKGRIYWVVLCPSSTTHPRCIVDVYIVGEIKEGIWTYTLSRCMIPQVPTAFGLPVVTAHCFDLWGDFVNARDVWTGHYTAKCRCEKKQGDPHYLVY